MLSSKRNHKSKCEKYLFDLFVTKPAAISNACLYVCAFRRTCSHIQFDYARRQKESFSNGFGYYAEGHKKSVIFYGRMWWFVHEHFPSRWRTLRHWHIQSLGIVDTRNAISLRSILPRVSFTCVCARARDDVNMRRVSSSFFNFILILEFAYCDSTVPTYASHSLFPYTHFVWRKKKYVSAIHYNVLDVFRRIILLFFCSRSLVFLRLFCVLFLIATASFVARYVSVSAFIFHSGYPPSYRWYRWECIQKLTFNIATYKSTSVRC